MTSKKDISWYKQYNHIRKGVKYRASSVSFNITNLETFSSESQKE